MRYSVRIARAAGLLAGLLIAAQPALALKLLTEENPPLNYTEGKKLTGMGTEVVQEMGRRAKVKLDFEVMAWNKAYEKAQADKETCLYSTARLANRENAFKWVGPIAVNKWGLFALDGFKQEIKSLNDAKPFRIGGVARDAKTEFLRQWGVTNIAEVDDDRLNPAKLTLNRKETGKIDLWITSVASAKGTAERAKVKDIRLILNLSRTPLYLACGRNASPQTVQALTKAFESATKDGTLKRIADRHAF